MQQVGGFLRVLRSPQPIKLTTTKIGSPRIIIHCTFTVSKVQRKKNYMPAPKFSRQLGNKGSNILVLWLTKLKSSFKFASKYTCAPVSHKFDSLSTLSNMFNGFVKILEENWQGVYTVKQRYSQLVGVSPHLCIVLSFCTKNNSGKLIKILFYKDLWSNLGLKLWVWSRYIATSLKGKYHRVNIDLRKKK